MKRVLCWLLGHRWHVDSAWCHRATTMTHLHTLAGCLARCLRCGQLWNDMCQPCFEALMKASCAYYGKPDPRETYRKAGVAW